LDAASEPRPRKAQSAVRLFRQTPQQILHPEIASVPGFTGREELIQALRRTLPAKGDAASLTTSPLVCVALCGCGGVGKSVLAREYAWRERESYGGVWWVRAENRQTLLDDLIALGAQLGIPTIEAAPDAAAAARLALERLETSGRSKPWLVVYDDAEGPAGIEELLPRCNANVLITTRRSDWYGCAAEVPIDVFPRHEAVDYLMAQARGAMERPEETLAEATHLADDVDCLPLALAIARTHAWGMSWTLAEYRRHLIEIESTRAIDCPRPAAAAIFELAIERAKAMSPQAARLLGIASFLAPNRIPRDIVANDTMSEIERDQALAALAEVSLIIPETLDDGSPGFSVHRVVQDVMRRRLCEGASEVAAVATRLMAGVYPSGATGPDDARSWPACRRLGSHAVAGLGHAPDSGWAAEKTVHLLNQYALYLNARAEHPAAEPLMRRALAISEKNFGLDHPMVATALNYVCGLQPHTNRVAEAEPMMRRALAIDEKSFGPDSPAVATDLNNLALVLEDTNRVSEAEPLYRRTLAIDEKCFGSDHPKVAIRLNNLAGLLQDTHRVDEAEPLMRRALAISEKIFGPDHPSVVSDLNNLALLLEAANRAGEAEQLYRRALTIDENSFGPDHPDVARDLNNLSLLLETTNRAGEAEPLYRRALAIDEMCFGPDHPTVATDLNNLAGLLWDADRPREAEPLCRRALAIDEKCFGPDSPNVATGLNNLAGLLQGDNRLCEAEPLMRRALAIDERCFGPDNPNVARDLNNLAELLRDTGRMGETEQLYRRALPMFEETRAMPRPRFFGSLLDR
jgi:tetratricopeptide (TPR) repeat protein